MSKATVATPEEYLTARLSLLEREKSLTKLRDSLAEERRSLPIVEVSKPYQFTTLDNKTVTLADLFANRRQLIIYHAMFDPEWTAACASCTLFLDHVPPLEHLASRDTSFAVVSRAPADKIKAYQERMGWGDKFTWVSSYGTDFNYDFHVTEDESVAPVQYNFYTKEELEKRGMPWFTTGEQPGHSVFVRGAGDGLGEAGKVYHSYSSYARGGEGNIGTYMWLDMTPLGRQDGKLENVGGLGFRRRDEYKAEEITAQ